MQVLQEMNKFALYTYISKHTKAVARTCSVKKVFLKISQNSQENTCASLFFNLSFFILKKRLQRSCFPVNFAKFLKTPFFIGHLQWLLLSRIVENERFIFPPKLMVMSCFLIGPKCFLKLIVFQCLFSQKELGKQ